MRRLISKLLPLSVVLSTLTTLKGALVDITTVPSYINSPNPPASNALVDAISLSTMGGNGGVYIPPGAVVRIAGDVAVPWDFHLQVAGKLAGDGRIVARGGFVLDGGGEIHLKQHMDPQAIQIRLDPWQNHPVAIRNVHFIGGGANNIDGIGSDYSYPSAIEIVPGNIGTGSLSSLEVSNCTAEHVATFVGRTGPLVDPSSISGVRILQNTISNVRWGDAIIWNNVGGKDYDVVISGNTISNIWTDQWTPTPWIPTAISIAAADPAVLIPNGSNPYPSANALGHGYTISNNTIKDVPIGIHTEYARDVLIDSNDIEGITELKISRDYVSAPGHTNGKIPENYGIVCYATENLTISNNHIKDVYSDGGHFVTFGNDNRNFWAIRIEGVAAQSYGYQTVWLAQNVFIYANYIQSGSMLVRMMRNNGSPYEPSLRIWANDLMPGFIEVNGRGNFDLWSNWVWTPVDYTTPSNPPAFTPYKGANNAIYVNKQNYFSPFVYSTTPCTINITDSKIWSYIGQPGYLVNSVNSVPGDAVNAAGTIIYVQQ